MISDPGINYLVRRKHATTITPFLETWSEMAPRFLRIVPYEEIELWRVGVNSFRAYPADALDKACRYPVFLRRANAHKGSLTPLLEGRWRYRLALVKLKLRRRATRDLIAVEFCDTAGSDGLYRKYAAFRIGERIIPGHIVFSDYWMAKQNDSVPPRDEEKGIP